MRARFEQMARSRQRQGGTVWVIDEQGKLKPYFVRTGITDNTYSEITRSELKEGMKIVIGLETAAASSQQQGGFPGPGRMMFMGGPR
jgi:multidrug efflux pump subunit AcrA (membrane-fusion protein)